MQGQYEDHTDDEEMEDKENAAPCHMPEMSDNIPDGADVSGKCKCAAPSHLPEMSDSIPDGVDVSGKCKCGHRRTSHWDCPLWKPPN